ncbi:helix-turn-helix transcriptional regulator [Ruegeria sp. 2205SS24-7]|uniref:helix-turn-helix domain-containing protein n=1 Tax=Ruegeria discodermiae TaxID=3064389 RepID=UPI0027413ACF|nr:helix-turn-helix transcriptional regulator [Ruegeria sp. 2205SS24-7]MDP5219509.1 helix-turn-helix transcriptional regulator [Ruegeria sp. 2205SS24-7]
MTQEQLADLLGVSVEAIGKYERSVSFIRGDLEYRLTERLGWGRGDVIACRKDWDTRRKPTKSRYRLLDDALVDTVFDGSWRAACLASIAMADAELQDLPCELEANEDVFLPIYETFRAHWAAIMCDGEMVAKWTLPFLLPEDEALFRAGQLIECDLSVDRLRRPILPGTYFGYCPALIVRPGHEAASALLMSSFVGFLETLAERDVYLHGIGTISVSPGGAQVCRDIGMIRLGSHCLSPKFAVWDLPGNSIPQSIFGRRSAFLRQRYAEAFDGT